jgi:superoxide reductase
MKIYFCPICGNVVDLLEDGGGQLVCCGQPMELLDPKSEDAGLEKHVPVVEVDGNKVTVTVGSVLHPMEDAHYITKIFLVVNNKVKRVSLKPGEEPKATFVVDEDFTTLEAYEYCNLHGLWKTTYNK